MMETEELTEHKVSFTRSRTWSIIFHVLLSSIAFLAVISMLNYLAHRHNQRIYLSNPAAQKLSPLTLRTLAELTNDVKIVCFFDRTETLFGTVSSLLKEYQARSARIHLEFVDHRMPGRAETVRAQYKLAAEGQASRVIFDSGGQVRTVLSTELSEYGMAPNQEIRRIGFRGEQLFTSALLNVTQNAPVTAYFLQGHGEHALSTDDQGYSRFATMLQNNNIKVMMIPPLLGTNGVPDDCGLLVVGGPSRKFEPEEIVNLERYLARGGRMLALMSISQSARVMPVGIEALLYRWNIQVGFDWVQDLIQGQSGDVNVILTGNYGSHAIVRGLLRSRVKLIVPRSVSERPTQQTAPNAPKVTEILFTSPRGQQAVATDASGNAEVRRTGAIPLAVAAERGAIQGVGAADTGSSRIVVVGESMFLSNQLIVDAANSDFANQIVNWLVSRDSLLTEIGPSPLSEYKILLTDEQMTQVRWLFLGAIPGFVLLFGFFVWVRRRV